MHAGVRNLDRFWKNHWFTALVYILMSLFVVYMLFLLKPMIMGIFQFLKAVLTPFIIAMMISYILNPIVVLLNQRKVPRTIAVLLIYSVFIVCVSVIIINVIPMLMNQLVELNEHLPQLAIRGQYFIESVNQSHLLPFSVRNGINHSLVKLESGISTAISNYMNQIGATINMLFIAFIIPFLAFYMLKDFQLIEKTAIAIVPQAHRKPTIKLLVDIDRALGNYIRGQLIVCVIVGVLAYIGYWIIKMPYPLLLASIVAVFNIIPYLGPFFGAAPAVLMASTVSVKMMIIVAILNLIIQMLEGNVISPQVVGRTLHMHPLFIIFALLVGGEIAGIAGLILAVPFFAALKVIVQHLFQHYINRSAL
jgi:predicted PurR-regulated permease PerM